MRTILVAIFIAILLYVSYNKLIDVPINYVIILGILSLILTYDCDENFEHLTDSQAIQNCASIVNGGNATVQNLNVTGKINVLGTDGKTVVASVDNSGKVVGSSGTFGPAFIGNASGFAGFTHVNNVSNNSITGLGNNSGVQVGADSKVIINNRATITTENPSNIVISGTVTGAKGGVFGSMYIGNSQKDGWAGICPLGGGTGFLWADAVAGKLTPVKSGGWPFGMSMYVYDQTAPGFYTPDGRLFKGYNSAELKQF